MNERTNEQTNEWISQVDKTRWIKSLSQGHNICQCSGVLIYKATQTGKGSWLCLDHCLWSWCCLNSQHSKQVGQSILHTAHNTVIWLMFEVTRFKTSQKKCLRTHHTMVWLRFDLKTNATSQEKCFASGNIIGLQCSGWD